MLFFFEQEARSREERERASCWFIGNVEARAASAELASCSVRRPTVTWPAHALTQAEAYYRGGAATRGNAGESFRYFECHIVRYAAGFYGSNIYQEDIFL